jgi:hypothetical protein
MSSQVRSSGNYLQSSQHSNAVRKDLNCDLSRESRDWMVAATIFVVIGMAGLGLLFIQML